MMAALAFALPSCESFEETNTNPNGVNKNNITPMYLASVTMVRSSLTADLWQRMINLGTDTFAQYFSNDKYSSNQCVPDDSYAVSYWNESWSWIANLNEAIGLCDTPEEENIKQICRIWRVWVYSRLTDFFGDVPYSQACDPDYTEPRYDSQKDIYYDMLLELAEASAAIDTSMPNNVGAADLLLAGDWAKWKALANTLRLRLALRLTEVDPAKAKLEAEAAAAAQGGFLTDDLTIEKGISVYTSNVGWNLFYPYAHYWSSRLTLSSSMEKILTNLGGVAVEMKDYYQPQYVPEYADPRALIYFNVTSEGTKAAVVTHTETDENGNTIEVVDTDYRGRWQGVKPGYSAAVAAQPDNLNTNHARIGAFFISDDPTPPVTEAPELTKDRAQILVYGNESYFLLAEAALRGYSVGGTAEAYYEQGIRKSMASYGTLINSDDVESYLQSDMKNLMGTSVAFNSADGSDLAGTRNSKLMKIITQKYIAGFPENSFEAWNDYRRLGMPALDPFEMPQPGYVMEPKAMDYKGSLRRYIYPAIEQTLNATSYAQAAAAMGGDNTTSRMWWDARTTVVE